MQKRKQPKVIHSTFSKDIAKVEGIWKEFSKSVFARIRPTFRQNMPNWDDDSDENLLALRKKLVAYVKMGMGARKDMEEHIAMYACLVWFNRLEKEKRDRITDLW